MAQTIDAERQVLDDHVRNASSFWQGDGYEAFHEEWFGLSANVLRGTDQLRMLAGGLDDLAAQIEDAHRQYDAAMVAAGVAVAVGLALTVFTFGSSNLVAGSIAADTAVAAVVAAEAASVAAASTLAAIAAVLSDLATLFVVGFGVSLGSQMVASAVVYPDHNPFDHLSLSQMVLSGAGFAVLGPLAARLSAGSVPLLGSFGVEATTGVKVFGMALGGGTFDAAAQLLTTGHIDPGQVLFVGGATAGVTALGLGAAGLRQRLLVSELGESFDPDLLLAVGRSSALGDRIVFLEEGLGEPQGRGLLHIIGKHGDEFARAGVPPERLPQFIFDAVTKGKIVAEMGSTRPVYAIEFDGQLRYVRVTVSDNGYVVGATPMSRSYSPPPAPTR